MKYLDKKKNLKPERLYLHWHGFSSIRFFVKLHIDQAIHKDIGVWIECSGTLMFIRSKWMVGVYIMLYIIDRLQISYPTFVYD